MFLFCILVAWAIMRYGVTDLVGVAKGNESTRHRERMARDAQSHEARMARMALGPTIPQAVGLRLADRIRNPKPPKDRSGTGPFRRFWGQFWSDCWDSASAGANNWHEKRKPTATTPGASGAPDYTAPEFAVPDAVGEGDPGTPGPDPARPMPDGTGPAANPAGAPPPGSTGSPFGATDEMPAGPPRPPPRPRSEPGAAHGGGSGYSGWYEGPGEGSPGPGYAGFPPPSGGYAGFRPPGPTPGGAAESGDGKPETIKVGEMTREPQPEPPPPLQLEAGTAQENQPAEADIVDAEVVDDSAPANRKDNNSPSSIPDAAEPLATVIPIRATNKGVPAMSAPTTTQMNNGGETVTPEQAIAFVDGIDATAKDILNAVQTSAANLANVKVHGPLVTALTQMQDAANQLISHAAAARTAAEEHQAVVDHANSIEGIGNGEYIGVN